MDACQSRNSDNPVSQTIDEILERVRLEVRRRNLKLAPDLDETNGAVTPIAFQASERLTSDIRQLVDTGRFSNVTEQVYQPTPSSTLSVRGFLHLHDQHFVNFVYVSILGQAPESLGRDLRQLRQGEDRCSILVCLRYFPGGRTPTVKIKGLLLHLRYRKIIPAMRSCGEIHQTNAVADHAQRLAISDPTVQNSVAIK
jgi:hypothetical protein